MKFKQIIAGTSAIALSLSMTSVAFADQTITSDVNLEVEVQSTLQLDCYDKSTATGDTVIALTGAAGLGIVAAGVPAVGEAQCTVITNDQDGFFLRLHNTSATGNVLKHVEGYQIPDKTAYDQTNIQTAAWTGTGLGFSMTEFPNKGGSTINTNVWTDTNGACTTGVNANKFSGIPDSAQTVMAYSDYVSGTSTVDTCFKVDVLPTQQSGFYTGQVTYTATTDAKSYGA